MRPLIGIPTLPFKHIWSDTSFDMMKRGDMEFFWQLSALTEKIISCVRKAGGMPVPLSAPPTQDAEQEAGYAALRFDGFVLAGGDDITPSLYGEPDKGTIDPDDARDAFEFAVCRAALALDKPVFGICRGCQLLNAALGGTLIQHLPDVHPEWTLHRRPDVTKGYVHDVMITAPQFFPDFRGQTMRVNSMHHQAVGEIAPSVHTAAVTSDGLVEAIYAPQYKYAFAVQWHPECLAPHDRAQAALFNALVEHSRA